jgi:hypothetical protein
MTFAMRQITTRAINGHLASMTSYCYIDLPDGRRIRVSRVRTVRGAVQGRVIMGSPKWWETIPPDAIVELS